MRKVVVNKFTALNALIKRWGKKALFLAELNEKGQKVAHSIWLALLIGTYIFHSATCTNMSKELKRATRERDSLKTVCNPNKSCK